MKSTQEILFRYLPLRISRAIHSLPPEIFEILNEIRLRRDAPLSVTAGQKNLTFDENGRICGVSKAMRLTQSELDECILRLTEGSRYTCDEFISQGFIPLAEGGRVGVCGRYDSKNGFTDISSLSLRLHRFIPNAARLLTERFSASGVCGAIVCSPPAMGKTTFLKSAAYMLSSGVGISPKRVCIADERCEIAAGLPSLGLCDVLSGMPKALAITMLTRTMSPEIIICDEISATEAEAVAEAQNTGVCLIASAHCEDISALLRRGRMKNLLTSGVFPLFVKLGYGYCVTVGETEAFL